MSVLNICGFCGAPAEHVVEGPNDRYACLECLLRAREVIQGMQQTYQCSFCFEAVPGSSLVEGPNELHICQACVESGIKLLAR
jgi:hypothetical protein